MKIKAAFILLIVAISNTQGQTIYVSGQATYFDTKTETTKPIVGAQISLETYVDGVFDLFMSDVYTDQDGLYSFSFSGSQPDQITTRIYFSNANVSVESWGGVRSDYNTIHPVYPDCDPPMIPCDFSLSFGSMSFLYNLETENNEYANIFMMTNEAANFATQNGFTPSTVTIRYPASESIINDFTLSNLTNSFFWPFETIDNIDETLASLLSIYVSPLVGWMYYVSGHDFRLTENTIYLHSNFTHRTIFHEYGHFLHRSLRGGDWPITQSEYITGDEVPTHQFNDYNQTPKQAFVEGFADYYGTVVYDNLYNADDI